MISSFGADGPLQIDPTALSMLGIAAGVLILVGWVEQIYKGYKTKHLRDVSTYLMVFIGAGATLWSIYGIIMSDVFIIGTNVVAIILIVIVLCMKRSYGRRAESP